MEYDMNNTAGTGGGSAGTFLLGILVGALVGGVTALLLAPQTGTDTRGLLKDRFGRVRDMVRSKGQEAADKVSEMADEAQ